MFYENETSPVIEAHYTNSSARWPATVQISERVRGDRQFKQMIAFTPQQLALLRPTAAPPEYVIAAYKAARPSANPTFFVRKM